MNNSARARIVGRAHVQSRIYMKPEGVPGMKLSPREPRSFPLTMPNLCSRALPNATELKTAVASLRKPPEACAFNLRNQPTSVLPCKLSILVK